MHFEIQALYLEANVCLLESSEGQLLQIHLAIGPNTNTNMFVLREATNVGRGDGGNELWPDRDKYRGNAHYQPFQQLKKEYV